MFHRPAITRWPYDYWVSPSSCFVFFLILPGSCQQMLWSDEVASEDEPVSSTRMFLNMFLLDGDRDISEAVVTARLPYDHVYIFGSSKFEFLSNDVVRIPYVYL